MNIFCLSIYDKNLNLFKELKLKPVGLGKTDFDKNWINDKKKNSISHKNINFGEYTFHYSLWKNFTDYSIDEDWIGFCTYRRFWVNTNIKTPLIKDDLKKIVLKEKPKYWDEYETILPEPFYVNKIKKIKVIKNAYKEILRYPSLLFKKNYNIRDHFYIFHGSFFINKAIELLDVKHRSDFSETLNQNYFSPFNMFVCKNKEILFNYYEELFSWLFDCEEVFSKKDLTGYGKIRIYGFLAERFASYWFNKYTKVRVSPIIFFDTHKNN